MDFFEIAYTKPPNKMMRMSTQANKIKNLNVNEDVQTQNLNKFLQEKLLCM